MTVSKTKGPRALRILALALASTALVAPAAHADKLKLTVLAPVAKPQGGAVKPLYGNISAFYGNISAFWGNISAFYGNISAFYGNISAFNGSVSPSYGNISAFYGNISAFGGGVTPSYGNISAFQGAVDPFWGNISAFNTGLGANVAASSVNYGGIGSFWTGISSQWTNVAPTWSTLGAYGPSSSAAYATVGGQLSDIVAKSSAFWGASVTKRTGLSFDAGFVTPFMQKWGIDLSNPATLASLNPDQQARFMMAWYDGLMEFTGTDHVDHWMSEVNWTPALTQAQSSGGNSVIGLLDFTVKDAPDVQDNVISSSGISTFSNGHGAAVASLMVSAHDGKGVMGIAPRASVVAYNPFDSTGTASWTDVTTGMIALGNSSAGVINASLGVPGYTLSPDWNAVLMNPALKAAAKNTILVVAAGNDGSTQTTNLAWDKGNMPVIVVGSIDPNLNISSFSNRPGTACLTAGGKCTGDYLMNHFIVASGENMLVSDDNGSFTRMSGTSFAAPLVSGAIALLQDRWPWLTQHPSDTSYIILKTAKDLGAPGPDPVYGVGLLDVTASQSPINYSALSWYQLKNGSLQQTATSALQDPKQQATWEASGAYVYAYEKLPESFRDFAIPLSSKLVGQSVLGATGQMEQLQYYLTSSFTTWLGTAPSGPSSSGSGPGPGGPAPGKFAMMDFRSSAHGATLGQFGDFELSLSATPHAPEPGWRTSQLPFNTDAKLTTTDQRSGLKFGFGNGGAALGGVTGMNLQSDYDPIHGGANPLLGFASGGAYGAVDLGLAPGLRLSGGVTTRDSHRNLDGLMGPTRLAAYQVGDYRAAATRVGLTWRAGSRVQFSGGWTRLSEADALLGVQSSDPGDLRRGSATNGMDLGADVDLGRGFTASATGMIGRTEQTGDGVQNLTVGKGGLATSSFQLTLAKSRIFGKSDQLRVSLSQPMYINGGKLNYTGVQVVDRQSGELGQVTQSFDPSQQVRPLAAQVMYGRPAFGGAGQIGLFGRAETRGVDAQGHSSPVFMTGAGLHLSF